jgi:imidazolonepropionase-like amidohydrolase
VTDTLLRVDDLWLGTAVGPALLRLEDDVLNVVDESEVPESGALESMGASYLAGTVLPGLVDAHVHFGLIDYRALAGSAVVEAHDLGWLPGAAAGWRAALAGSVRVEAAGPFHTAPGGYPAGRSWAPDGAVRAVTDPAGARAAVAEVVAAGAHTVKVTAHTGGPLLDDETLEALVDAGHAAGLPVSVHAEGAGQAARALAAGADVLVHAPWTEALDDATVEAIAATMTWISTLAIHEPPERAVATDNLRRFVAAGGRVRYGTDMGNGPTPVGANPTEIRALGAAGLSGDALLTALTGITAATTLRLDRALFCPLPAPRTAAECAAWFSTAQRLTAAAPEVSAN